MPEFPIVDLSTRLGMFDVTQLEGHESMGPDEVAERQKYGGHLGKCAIITEPVPSARRCHCGKRLKPGLAAAERTMEELRQMATSPAGFLREWWVANAEDEAGPLAEKAATYGSNSLAEMGMLFARANGRTEVSHEEALELGCFVYIYGKVQRWADAALRGERPKTDTILDTHVYAKMVLRIRETGDWP